MSKISVKRLKSLTEDCHGETLREPGGIVGRVRSGVRGLTVIFRYEVWLNGKKRDFSLGSWPKKSLTAIREEHNHLRLLVAEEIKLINAKKFRGIKQQLINEGLLLNNQAEFKKITVHDLFHSWVKDGVARQNDNKELHRLFAKDILPTIGTIPLYRLNERDILAMLRQMLSRGITRQAVIAYNDTKQMLSWGEKRRPWRSLMDNGNPCDLIDIKKLLPIDYEEERDRILSIAEIRELHDIFLRMDEDWLNAPDRRNINRPFTKKSQIALWLCLGTICRIGELLQARWEHVDLETGIWFIPRQNVKGVRNKKQEHYVFLSNFTHSKFIELKATTGASEWCFPSRTRQAAETHVCLKSISKQVGDRQVAFKEHFQSLKGRVFNNDLVLSNGVNGKWTPHDLRRTGATMMQALDVNLDVIDRCQKALFAL